MIKILVNEYSQSIAVLKGKLDSEAAEYDLFISKNKSSCKDYLTESIKEQSLILIGNVGENSALFADTFGLTMFYDTFVEQNIIEYCKTFKLAKPSQYALDKLCLAPETFNHLNPEFGLQFSCFGEYQKCHVYIIPDDKRELEHIYSDYFYKDYFKYHNNFNKYTFKVFGLGENEVKSKLSKLNKIVSQKYETRNLDTKIVLSFPPKCAQSVVLDTLKTMDEMFGESIYAKNDQSLAQTAVSLLMQLSKTVSTAESITGGMIASAIVDVPGASAVFVEGAVTYSIAAKCNRLGLNPHFIDEFGVVSKEVARQMAIGLRRNGCDIAVATTGYAGPTADNGLPVGLCFISVSTESGSMDGRFVFKGDRNSIRAQAANAALYMICSKIIHG